jgi:pectate lyase
MKEMKSLKSRFSMSLLLCAVILFSQCKKETSEEFYADPTTSAVMATTSSTTVVSGTLNVSAAVSDGGYAYYIGQDLKTPGDNNNNLTVSTIRVFEDGKEIGPAHSVHKDIRQSGSGRFSHWNTGIYISASDNSNPKTNGRKYTYTNSTTTTPTETTAVSGTLDVSKVTSDGGFAYLIAIDPSLTGDSNEQLTVSKVKIFENGVEIGPAHAVHADIRNYGKGRFSHWGSTLRFSASDNTNPSSNGRVYTYTTGSTAPSSTTSPTTTSPTTTGVALNLSLASSDGGNAYVIGVDASLIGDSNTQPTVSTMKIFENGKEIGPAHATHADIRSLGKGRFSHWGSTLRFSSSDNSNPKTNGRKYTYTVGGSSSTTAPTTTTPETTSPTTTTPTTTSGLIGFATQNGGTTGGAGGQTVTVSTLSALQSALSSTSPMIINISGTINGSGMYFVKSNKTINGLSGAVLNGMGLQVWTESNVIIRNVKIQNSPLDAVTIRDNAHHVWIDHCWLDRAADELVDVSRGGDFVTVSWTRFTGSNYGVLVGGGAVESMNTGKLNVTLHHNYFYDIAERVPFASTGIVHFFNNYVHHQNVPYNEPQVDAWNAVNIRVENNYFKNIANRTIRALNQYGSGKILNLNNTMENCPNPLYVETAPSTWAPSYEYKSALHSATDVPSSILNGVGPK